MYYCRDELDSERQPRSWPSELYMLIWNSPACRDGRTHQALGQKSREPRTDIPFSQHSVNVPAWCSVLVKQWWLDLLLALKEPTQSSMVWGFWKKKRRRRDEGGTRRDIDELQEHNIQQVKGGGTLKECQRCLNIKGNEDLVQNQSDTFWERGISLCSQISKSLSAFPNFSICNLSNSFV